MIRIKQNRLRIALPALTIAALLFNTAYAGEAGRLIPTRLDVPEKLKHGTFGRERILNAPSGFSISLFAADLGKARFMALGPGGNIYISIPKKDYILVLPDRNKDGVADRKTVFARGLEDVHGLAFHNGDLYAAGTGKIYRLRDKNRDLRADKVEVISEDIPGSGGHWTRTIVAAPDNKLYVSAGSSCNACMEKDPRRAAILRYPIRGGKGEIFARGLRNSVGLALHPETDELWASNNGRDWLGDNLPPEEINRVIKGGDYGWPFCYGDRIVDPDYGTPARCRKTLPPEVEMQAHSAPLGITFGHGLDFPLRYRNMLFVAFHGSWNRSVPTGYKLVGIPFKNGKPAGPVENIVTGWLVGDKVWGRPVSPIVGADGALYLSDDKAGAIYRISFTGEGDGRGK